MEEEMKIHPDKIPIILQSLWNYELFPSVVAGINDDDCGVIRLNDKLELVITTDFLNANPIAVELGISDEFDLGRLIVASSISDLCGSGALPIAFLLGLTMAKDDEESHVINLVKGVKKELDKINIPLIGGDTKLGQSRSFIGTAIGISDTNSRKLFLKNKAKVGDNIWVSGEIGGNSAAVLGLTNSLMDEKWNSLAKETIICPQVPLNKSNIIAKSKIGNGGTDLSDGLGADLHNLLDSSSVGANIYTDLIPCNKLTIQIAEKLKVPPWVFAFIIGGDFQFVVTADPTHDSVFEQNGFIRIGSINSSRKKSLIYNQQIIEIPSFGHEDGRRLCFKDEVLYIFNSLKKIIYED